jgi:signal transduction histidine kinase
VFSDLLAQPPMDSKRSYTLKKLHRTATDMIGFIDKLQHFGRVAEATDEPVRISLDDVLTEVIEKLQIDFPDVSLNFSRDQLPSVPFIRSQMYLLFYEILFNAVWFRKDVANASVSISAAYIQRNSIQHIHDQYNYINYLRIEITDDGIGFDPVYTDKLFHSFVRLHNHSRRGLGLALCKKIIDVHNGMIEIKGDLNTGVSVVFFLPAEEMNNNNYNDE